MFSLQKQPPEAFCKKSVPKNFANFTGKHLYWSLFLIQLKAQKACNFIKKETSVQVLSREFCEIFKNTSFTEHLWMTVARTVRGMLSIKNEIVGKKREWNHPYIIHVSSVFKTFSFDYLLYSNWKIYKYMCK